MGFGDLLTKIKYGVANTPTKLNERDSFNGLLQGGKEGVANIPTSGDGDSIVYPFTAVNNSSFNRYNPINVSFNVPTYGLNITCNVPDYIALDCPFDDNGMVYSGLKFVGTIIDNNTGKYAIIGRIV